MSAIKLDTVVSRADGFTTAPVHDELMMLDVAQGAYYSLDPIAAEIWGMLEQPMQVQELVKKLQQRYSTTPEQCQADVLSFLAEMHANRMLVTK